MIINFIVDIEFFGILFKFWTNVKANCRNYMWPAQIFFPSSSFWQFNKEILIIKAFWDAYQTICPWKVKKEFIFINSRWIKWLSNWWCLTFDPYRRPCPHRLFALAASGICQIGCGRQAKEARRVADKIMGSACFYCTAPPANMDHANPILFSLSLSLHFSNLSSFL